MTPIKPRKIPQNLIYNPKGTDLYKLINLKNGSVIGQMVAYPSINKDVYIASLAIYRERRQGFGKMFLDFAKNMSKKCGFEGRMSVYASTLALDPHNPPHIFYRKYGFVSEDKEMLNKIDKCIKNRKQLDYRATPSTLMYYEEDFRVKKYSLLERLKNYFIK